MAEYGHEFLKENDNRMKLEIQFNPIYAQDAGMNIAVTDEMCVTTIIAAVVARADLVFQGDDGDVVYQPVPHASCRGNGHLNIDCKKQQANG